MGNIQYQHRKAVMVAFAMALLILVLIGAGSFLSTRRIILDRASRRQSRELSDRLEDLETRLDSAEAAERGYLLTGDSSYLGRCEDSLNSLDQSFLKLGELTIGDSIQSQDLAKLKSLMAVRISEFKETIDARRDQGLEAARKIVTTNAGKRTMDGIRSLITAMDNRELAFIERNLNETDARDSRRNLAMLLGGGLSMLLLFFAFLLLNRVIAGHERAEDSLRKSEEQIRSLFENMLNGFAYCRMLYENGRPHDFIYLDVNKAFGTLTGLKNVVGKKVSEVIPGIRESDPEILEIYGRVASTGFPERHEIYVDALNGWFSIAVYSPLKDHFVAVFDVITERKRAEEELVKLNRVYAVISQINQLIVRTRDAETLFPEACRIAVKHGNFRLAWIGMKEGREGVVKPVAWDGVEDGYLTSIKKISVADVPEGRGPAGTSIREGKTVCCNDIATDPIMAPWRDEAIKRGYRSSIGLPLFVHGNPIGVLNLYAAEPFFFSEAECELLKEVTSDLSFALGVMEREKQRKRADVENIRLSAAVEQTSEAVVITDPAGNIQYVNPAFTWITGYSSEEVINQNPRILKSGVQDEKVYQDLWKTIQSGKTWQGEIINRRKDGTLYPEWMTITPVLDSAGGIANYIAIKQDVTQRRRAEDAFRHSEERFRKAFNTNPEPVTISTIADGRYIDVNEAFLRTMGYRRDEVIGRTSAEINFWEMQEDRDAFIRLLSERGEVHSAEINFRTKSGGIRSGLVSAETIELDGQQCLLAVTQDVTERKELQQQFLQAQKMEAVGKLAGGVAHDFNNILTVINGYSEVMLGQLQEDDPNRSYVGEIKKAGERAATLTRQLLAFSRRQVLLPQVLDLNSVINNMDKMLRRLIGEDVELVATMAKNLGHVKADPGQVEQILMNLAVNARDAMPRGGKLTIETANVELDESYASKHVTAKPGPHVMLAISDTGAGMDAEIQKRIFDPFFTTKEKGKGTGLGLSTVYGIVKQSEGHIWVYSEPGHGTTFKVYLPRVDKPVEAAGLPMTNAELLGGTETVLLVEDEPSVRSLVRTTLEAKGYQLLEATQATEALSIAEKHQGRIHLMLTDLIMPGMSGRLLAQKMADLRPETKVVYMSGYTDDAVVRHGGLGPGMAFLQKPFAPDALARKVRSVLDTGPA
jgi:PAS domain S-box-containing protein